jgi:hypothetical protein
MDHDDPAIPPQVSEELVEQAATKVRRTRPAAAVDAVRLQRLAEMRCAQVLHTGPYREETPTNDRLYAFIRTQGWFATHVVSRVW